LNFEDLKTNLLEYGKPRPPRHHTDAYYMAWESVRRDLAFTPGSIVPLTTGAVAKHPDLPSTKSPGLPFNQMGYKTKADVLDDPVQLARIRQTWYDIEAKKHVDLPDVACFARSHIATRDKNKIRATWGYPLEVYMGEAQYFYPILEHLKNLENPIIAYGLETSTGGMTFVDSMVRAFPTRPVGMFDWSGFDHTIPAWLIRDAFRILAEAIDWSNVQDSEGKHWHVRDFRSKRRWNALVNYFIDTPIRLSNGERYQKHCGVPSGSCFTNIIDSIVNAIVMRYATYELTGRHPLADVYLGDDSLIVLPKLINLHELHDFCFEQFGMVLNVEKSYVTHDRRQVCFLGYYNRAGYPDKPIDSIIASSIYPEHTVKDKVETIARLVGQAFSCYDPTPATAFLRAADILRKEEGLSPDAIDSYIQEHPYRFKYLMTLGIDPKKIGIPQTKEGYDTWRTMPGINRRRWSHRDYDEDALYRRGIVSYSACSSSDFEVPVYSYDVDEYSNPF
jgi:hypothetical protein